ncbi:NYN domain-containing protein [Candidatus Acetothermia bacterium]|nr:NYN domain-containing protein [Candidatus Acetothermia bacterium]
MKIQNGIALKHKSVEFRRAGSIKYDLFHGTFGSEKSVDVKLAVDLLELRNIYDMAIIVSGDQDYVPAVEAIKNYGKEVINVVFKTKHGRLLPGGAMRLNQCVDWSCEVLFDECDKHLF